MAPQHVSSSCTPIPMLSKNRLNQQLKARICSKFRVQPYLGNGLPSLELLLSDADSNRIQATIKNHLIADFDERIAEGFVYVIKKFCVVDQTKKFPVGCTPHKIVFLKDTKVELQQLDEGVPSSIYSFKKFSDILNTPHKNTNPLFDVIGGVLDLKVVEEETGHKKYLEVLLRDNENNKLHCVLWEPYKTQLKDFVEGCKKGKFLEEVVIIIQLARSCRDIKHL